MSERGEELADQLREGSRWWRDDESSDTPRHEKVCAWYRRLKEQQEHRRARDLLWLSMYGNVPLAGLGLRSYAIPSSGLDGRVSLNVVKNMCDAYQAKITRSKPKPSCVTSGADYSLRKRARGLEQFVDGVFYDCGFYDEAYSLALDSAIGGTGVVHVYRDERRIKMERVFAFELLVDDAEARYGVRGVRSLCREKWVDRLVLAERYPEHREAILSRARGRVLLDADDDLAIGHDGTSDQILVLETWRLPTSPGRKNGRRCLVIESATLVDEPYSRKGFPMCFLRRNKPPIGFWGIGLAAELVGIQREINKLLRMIQEGHHLMANPRTYIERGSKVLSAHLNNKIGVQVEYTGTMPQQAAPPVFSSEIYQHLWELYAKAYEITGISQLSAQSQIPSQIQGSGRAQQVFNDIETQRFVVPGREWEQLFSDAAQLVLEEAREISGPEKGYVVRAVDRRAMEEILFSDVDMPDDAYVLQMQPTSALASGPAQKMAEVEALFKLGVLPDVDAVRDLLDFPDLQREQSFLNAPRDLTEKLLEQMIEKQIYVAPEPTWNLDYMRQRMTYAVSLYGQMQNVPEAGLMQVRQFLAAIDKLQNPEPPAVDPNAIPQDPMAAMGGAPPMDPAMMAASGGEGLPPEMMSPGGMPANEGMPVMP